MTQDYGFPVVVGAIGQFMAVIPPVAGKNVLGWTNGSSAIGPTGPSGISGIQGPVGVTGLQGIQGLQGEMGLEGTQGAVGAEGVPGAPAQAYTGGNQLASGYVNAATPGLAAPGANNTFVTSDTFTFGTTETLKDLVIMAQFSFSDYLITYLPTADQAGFVSINLNRISPNPGLVDTVSIRQYWFGDFSSSSGGGVLTAQFIIPSGTETSTYTVSVRGGVDAGGTHDVFIGIIAGTCAIAHQVYNGYVTPA